MSLNFITNKYRTLGKVGEGTFSEVIKCENIKDGTKYACKKLKHQYSSLEQVNNLREIQAMRRLSPHPNILELQEVLFDKKSGTLVLMCELMDMNIYEMIRGRRHYLAEHKVKHMVFQLCKAIEHMHRNGIFHRDVKPENILIKDDVLKLADFGSCRSVHSKQPYTEYISTRWYRAPECLLTDGYYNYKMDVWSIGCVFFEVMSLHPLFPGSNEVDQIAKIHDVLGTPDIAILNKLRNKARGMNFNFPSKKGTGIEKMLPHASPECVELIYSLCTYDPDERLSAKQALKHPYFKELRDAEKRAAKALKQKQQQETEKQQQQQQQQEQSQDRPALEVNNPESPNPTAPAHEPPPAPPAAPPAPPADKENTNTKNRDKKQAEPPEKEKIFIKPVKKKSPRPTSGSTIVTKYQASILQNRDPVFQLHRKDKRRRRNYNRMAGSGPSPLGGRTYFPKVTHPVKPGTYQPAYQSNLYGVQTSSSLTKEGNTTSTSTNSFFPKLTQAFVKPTKAKNNQPTKNMYGRYQLPSIDRRNGGF